MNAARRKDIKVAQIELANLKAVTDDEDQKLTDATDGVANLKSKIETIRDEEQEYFDNMIQAFQEGEKGQKAQTAIDALNEALDSLDIIESELDDDDNRDSVNGALDDVDSNLDTAQE